MKRINACKHCGECCGQLNPRGKSMQPWPSNWPEAMDEWNDDALEEHILYKWIPHPRKAGHRSGVVDVDGTEYPYMWVPGVGLVKSTIDQHCPFLKPYVDENTGRCGLYGTSKHEVWENACGHFPPVEADMSLVVKLLTVFPSCSHTYVKEL